VKWGIEKIDGLRHDVNYPHCASTTTKEQTKKTSLGYRTLRCSTCRRTF